MSKNLIPMILPADPANDAAAPTGAGLAARCFVDAAMKTFAGAVREADPTGPIARSRAALGDERFCAVVRDSIERRCARALGDAELFRAAETVGAVAVDAEILAIVADVMHDVAIAARRAR